MVTEPQIDKKLLRSILEREYGFEIMKFDFNPKGWASWSYVVESVGGKKYFLKIFQNSNFSPNVFNFTYRLYTECKIANVVHPLTTRNNQININFNSFQLVLFNYIEGKTTSEQRLNTDELQKLGKLFANVHNSKQVIGEYPKKEELYLSPLSRPICNKNKSETINKCKRPPFIN